MIIADMTYKSYPFLCGQNRLGDSVVDSFFSLQHSRFFDCYNYVISFYRKNQEGI